MAGALVKLYFAPKTRATRPRWLLEELAVPYQLVVVDLAAGENRRPEYLAIHPHGEVPALVDGELTLIESAAICLHLADRHPERGLAPALGTPRRARYYQWFCYCAATLEPPIQQFMHHTARLPEPERVPLIAEKAHRRFDEAARVLTGALAGGGFLLGAELSAVDVILAANLNWARRVGLLGEHDVLEGYLERLLARPAAVRALAPA